MDKKIIRAAVHGLGNIGRHVLDCLACEPDFECLGVLRRPRSLGTQKDALRGHDEFGSLEALCAAKGKPDVAIICGPSREVPDTAAGYLAMGVNTVDSFDIHSELGSLLPKLEKAALAAGRAAVCAAGWDPGTDSVLRALFEAMVPTGTSFTNFGRGRSMGHSVAVRGMPGVADATSITIPMGGGRHSRLVYVLPEQGEDQARITAAIAKDPYFIHDPLEVRFVADAFELARVADNSHGVRLERGGASGSVSNQQLIFDMRINNPALTAQVLVAAARAGTRLAPGAYTLIDVPPVHLLPGDRLANVLRLV